MIKGLLEAIKAVLLKRKLCTGCTLSLDMSVKRFKCDEDLEIVTCRCGRRYFYEQSTETYRNLTEEEYQKLKTTKGTDLNKN